MKGLGNCLLALTFIVITTVDGRCVHPASFARAKRDINIVDRPENWTALVSTVNNLTVTGAKVPKFVPSPVFEFEVTNSTLKSNYGPVHPAKVQNASQSQRQEKRYPYPATPAATYSNPGPVHQSMPQQQFRIENEPINFMQPPHPISNHQQHQYGPPIVNHPIYQPQPLHRPHKPKHHRKKKVPFKLLSETIIGKELLAVGTVAVIAGMVGVVLLTGLFELLTNMKFISAALPLILLPVALIPALLFIPALFVGLLYVAVHGVEEGERKERRRRRNDDSAELSDIELYRIMKRIEQDQFMERLSDSLNFVSPDFNEVH